MQAERIGPQTRGVTLIELILVMVLFSGLAATLSSFYKPAVDAWIANGNRARLVAEAHQAAWRVIRDVQTSVPNALRAPSDQCLESVPTSTGGRMRLGDDGTNGGTLAAIPGNAVTGFDVLTTLNRTPAVGDWVVIDNQNANDVHAGLNRRAITAVSTPAATAGALRLAIDAGTPLTLPSSFDGGRFQVVPASQQAVFYICDNVTGAVDARGDGVGRVMRAEGYGFSATVPTSCPSTAGADVLVTGVTRCRILYQPNQGATQQSGYVSIELELTRGNETASLLIGGHVLNVP